MMLATSMVWGIDASAAVDLAATWTNVEPEINFQSDYSMCQTAKFLIIQRPELLKLLRFESIKLSMLKLLLT